jgi:hypothetical protein
MGIAALYRVASKTQKDNFDFGAKLISKKMSDINIEAFFYVFECNSVLI